MGSKSTKSKSYKDKTSLWAKFSLYFYDHVRVSASLWIAIIVVGILCFTTFLDREGFPPVQFPIGVISGTYFVDDATKIDNDITKPLSKELSSLEQVEDLDTITGDNFFSVIAIFDDQITSAEGVKLLKDNIESNNLLPEGVSADYAPIEPASFLGEYDLLLSVYSNKELTAREIDDKAKSLEAELTKFDAIDGAEILSQFETALNPATGKNETRQASFGRIGVGQENERVTFTRSITVGIYGASGYDVIELSDEIDKAISEVSAQPGNEDIEIIIAADFAESINNQIKNLQDNLLTGLIAVTIISFLLITWRASVITAIFMVSVMLAILFVLWILGYTLNTITLFALVLSLGLFVDDATIIVEAIDANRTPKRKGRETVKVAITKVAAASFAGTMTTILVFLPLAFITGILGEFIRILPLTVIIALTVSLILSLSLIPFLSRNILLNRKFKKNTNPISRLEVWLSNGIASWPQLIKRSRVKGAILTISMILVSFGFIFGSGYYASQLKFNIFPETKDSDQISIDITYKPETTIVQAEEIAAEVDQKVEQEVGENLFRVLYGYNAPPSARSADAIIELTPFTSRDITSIEIAENLKNSLAGYDKAIVRVKAVSGGGPPGEDFPFRAQVFAEDTSKALPAAKAIEQHLRGSYVTRLNGTISNITATKIAHVDDIARSEGKKYVEVLAAFDDDDITALLTAAQTQIEDEFTEERLEELGISQEDLTFDFGFESDSQESFSSLGVVGLVALLLMFVLLAIQFRSLLQPVLIFLAIPFSVFGMMFGLFITDNPISFFSMIGFFGLIGIAVNNTILIVDYANQERRAGNGIVDSISEATRKRFRPLITTSLTTIAALIPLALTDPFWESLAFTIIFGLASSTFLVIISFPYYYIVAEFLRVKTKSLFKRALARG